MKIARRKEAIERQNSDVCLVTEYPQWDTEMDFAVIHIQGRYPEKQRAVNVVCKEMVYIHEGNGSVEVNRAKHLVKSGDLVLIESGEKFIWEGEMTLFISCRPAFYVEQHHLVD